MSVSLAREAIQKLTAYESARSLNIQGKVFLDANEAPESPLEDFPGLNRYPEPQPEKLVRRLCSIYGVPSSRLIIGRGSDEAIDLLVRVFCEAGKDRILICPPTYGMYEISAKIQGVEIVKIPMILDRETQSGAIHPALDEEKIVAAIGSGVKMIFICSPNNPTGTPFEAELLVRIAKAATDRAIVVIDEAYAEFSDRKSMVAEVERLPNLVVLRTLSKAWAIAGARCGVAISSEPLIKLLQKVRAPYPLSAPAVGTILKSTDALRQEKLKLRVQSLKEARMFMITELAKLDCVKAFFPSDANFILLQTTDSKSIMSRAASQGVILRDRSSEPGLENCIRITLGTPDENRQVLEILGARS